MSWWPFGRKKPAQNKVSAPAAPGPAVPSAPLDAPKPKKANVRQIGEAPATEIIEAMENWLASHGPKEWHAVAKAWNWDFGSETLEWILAQPECDQATAALIFWRSSPDTILSCETEEEAAKAYNLKGFRLAHAVLGGKFTQANISLDDTEMRTPDVLRKSWASLRTRFGSSLDLPDWLYGPFTGDTVTANYLEGIPRPIIEKVYPGWEEGWGD